MSNPGISRFIARDEPARFDQLATALVERQLREDVVGCVPPWSDLSARSLGSWQAIPPVPAATLPHPYRSTANDELVRLAMLTYWQTMAPANGLPILLLALAAKDSAAGQLTLAVKQAASSAALNHPLAGDTLAVRSWLAARQRGDQPATIVATSDLADRFCRFLERRRLLFRLPTGSRLFTIDTLSTAADLSAPALSSLVKHLGLAPDAARHLVIVPTLTTPLQTVPGHQKGQTLVAPPHWVRYRLAEDQLVIMDLATTRYPACQVIGLRAAVVGGRDEASTLILQS